MYIYLNICIYMYIYVYIYICILDTFDICTFKILRNK